jgi:hypothetical protein
VAEAPGNAEPAERRAAIEARLASEKRPLARAIEAAFRETDWDDLAHVAGDLHTGLARLAAGVAWIEGRRETQPSEDAARQREARHRASVAITTKYAEEWVALIRKHRAEVDAERGPLPAEAPTAPLATGSRPAGLGARLTRRFRARAR